MTPTHTDDELRRIEFILAGEDCPSDVWFVDTITKLAVDNRKLREALRPFAVYGKSLPAEAIDDRPMDDAGDRTRRAPMPTVGDCRTAAELVPQ